MLIAFRGLPGTGKTTIPAKQFYSFSNKHYLSYCLCSSAIPIAAELSVPPADGIHSRG
jgi:hypothetical protein